MMTSRLKFLFEIAVLVVVTASVVSGRCSTAEIHRDTSKCLTDSMVQNGTDPLVPVLNNSAAVINFCMRNIDDIKGCITRVISPCTSDKRVKVIFGTKGAALLAAYDGICNEQNKSVDMTCAFDYAEHISTVVHELIHNVDKLYQHRTSFYDMCTHVHTLLHNITEIYDTAVESGNCSTESHRVMHQYLKTIVFPCSDVATVYYPCTLKQINADAMHCYANNGVNVGNTLIPTTDSPSNADEMCGSKDHIFDCLKNVITKCLYEPQVATLYGSALESFEAAFNCMCSLDNSDKVVSCAGTSDDMMLEAIAHFTSSVHNHSIMGTWNMDAQCDLEGQMAAQISSAMDHTRCTDKNIKRHWQVYMDTIIYPCTQTASHCYPENMYNGVEPIYSMPLLFVSYTSFGLLMVLYMYMYLSP